MTDQLFTDHGYVKPSRKGAGRPRPRQRDPECRFPDVSPLTGYRYSCRCDRCSAAHAEWRPRDRCALPECSNPRRQVQGAKYCEEHSCRTAGVQTPNRLIASVCWVCSEPCSARMGSVIRLCSQHQHLRRIITHWSRHHVGPERARQWLADPRCWICDLPLTLGWGAAAADRVHVDHRHDCCPGAYSCGNCVRGLAHQRCNMDIGVIEAMIAHTGIERMHIVIDLLRP